MRIRGVNSLPYLLAAITLFLLASAFQGPAVLGNEGASIEAFARRAAGTYLVEIPERGERYLFAVSADGRLLSEDSNDFGDGVPAASQSAFHGTWKRVGRRALVYTVLNLGFDGGGVNTTFVRHSATVVFDRKFQTFHQDGTAAVFTVAQDPLDPAETPIATAEFSGSGVRIPALVSSGD